MRFRLALSAEHSSVGKLDTLATIVSELENTNNYLFLSKELPPVSLLSQLRIMGRVQDHKY